jgi:hypothetical protein
MVMKMKGMMTNAILLVMVWCFVSVTGDDEPFGLTPGNAIIDLSNVPLPQRRIDEIVTFMKNNNEVTEL